MAKKHRDITPGDVTGKALITILSEEMPTTILDIGASTGHGTTSIMRETCPDAKIFAIELADDRFKELKELFKDDKKTYLFKGSTCPPDELMKIDELKEHQSRFPHWDCWKSVDMYSWHKNHPETIKGIKTKYGRDLIPYIKKKYKIDFFDFVMIDGSPFTAKYELEQIHGAKAIMLDDINDVKNQLNYARMATGGQYWCVEVNKQARNGYAIYKNLAPNQ